jgi:hypothetical protein
MPAPEFFKQLKTKDVWPARKIKNRCDRYRTLVQLAVFGATKNWRAAGVWRGDTASLLDSIRLPEWPSMCLR